MWISEIAERSIMEAMAGLDVTMRASRVDNDASAPTERKKYPAMVIMAAGGTRSSTESLNDEVAVTVTIITHYKDDPKCTTLARLEDEFRKILGAKIAVSTIRTQFNAIALEAGETRYMKGVTDIDGGMINPSEAEQSIMTTMVIHVCGS